VRLPLAIPAGGVAAAGWQVRLPRLSDQRFHWVHGRMAVLGHDEMRELATDAWRMVARRNMVVPKKVVAAHLGRCAIANWLPFRGAARNWRG
jgi:hypothetical protein